MKYYIYIDDSNKFEKDSDNFVLYSYIVLTKEQRKKMEKSYFNIFNFIRNENKPFNIENHNLSKDELLYGPLSEKNNKGHQLICKYNRTLKYYEKHKKQNNKKMIENIESFLKIFSDTLYIGTLYWCKNCSINKEWKNIQQVKNKKKYMMKIILKHLLDKKVIFKNSEINMYFDNEFNDDLKVNLGDYFREYLNAPINDYLIGTEKMTYKLRINNIYVNNLEFLDSEISVPIRMADIIANLSNKILKNSINDWVTSPINVKNFFNKQKIEINWHIFPGFSYNSDVEQIRCCLYNK